MTTSVEPRETTRGADSGPPSAVSREPSPREPRIGPLPEPTLLERLRSSWSLAALVPAFDPREARKREWRPAAALAVALHVAAFVAIVVVGKYAIMLVGPTPEQVSIWLPRDVRGPDPSEPQPPSESGDPQKGPNSAGATSSGGGSNTDAKPVTAGPPPRTSPAPVVPPSLTPPLVAPALPVPQTVQGPAVDIPPPTAPPGIVGAPPAPEAPSLGDGGGTGVGTSPGGRGYGGNPGDGQGGDRAGPGGKGGDPNAARRPDADGAGGGLGERPAPGNTPDHGVRLTRKVKPAMTQAMIDNGTFGTVRFKVTIGSDGSIVSAEPLQTVDNGGTEAARVALYRCRFEPAVRGGKYVADTIVVRFDIRSLADN